MSVHVCPKRIKDNFESKVVNEMGQATEKSHTTLIRKRKTTLTIENSDATLFNKMLKEYLENE